MGNFGDVSTATRMRDSISSIVRHILRTERPDNVYATVQSINRLTRKCVVRFAGETTDIELPMSAIEPAGVGDTVRVIGSATDRYVDQPVGVTGNEPYVPYGLLAEANLTSNSAVFNTIIYPLSLPAIQPRAGRKVLIRCLANFQGNAGASNVSCVLAVCNNAGTILAQTYNVAVLANAAIHSICEFMWTPTTGNSEVFKMGVYTGSATAFVVASATAPSHIRAYDLGPA